MALRRQLQILIIVCCVGTPLTSVPAQTATTGTIEGFITDQNGAIVTGVAVTATSPNLIRTQSSVSDNEGRYRFPSLPPGKYVVTVEAAQGFARFVKDDLDVNLSKTSSLTIHLDPAGASAIVTVTYSSAPGVDTTSNTSGASVSTDQFSNFVTQRTVQSIYTIAP